MWRRLTSKLYVRIWLAVVASVAVLTFASAGIWHATREPREAPIREIVVRNKAGEVIGTAQTKPGRKPWEVEFDLVTRDGQTLNLIMPRIQRPPGGNGGGWLGPASRSLQGFGFGWLLALVGLAVALGSYPIIRRLTLRLEGLQVGVERWGAGDLSTRLDASGQDEVAFLAERFNRAAAQIERLLNSHKSLLANASHELRSPLARIRMSLELLAPALVTGGTAGPAGSVASQNLQIQEMARSITELDQLIGEILLASRLDATQAAAEPFEELDLTGLAAEECARAGVELSASTTGQSLLLQGSPRLLRRLIRNLLENAKRYGGNGRDAGGDVLLALTTQQLGGDDYAVIAVQDRGPGVPVDARERIFEPFFRLPGASERDGGVGLGLALVQSISELHHGTARCEDRPGGGASFVVELRMTGSAGPTKINQH